MDSIARPRRRRREILTDAKIASLKRQAKPYLHPDTELRQFGVRVHPNGPPHAYYVVVRDPFGKQRWKKVAPTDAMTIEQGRAVAREMIARIKRGLPAVEPPPVQKNSVAEVCDNWYRRHVLKSGVRTAPEIRRIIDKYVLPTMAKREFATLRRSDFTELLDSIEDKHSATVADAVLVVLRSVATWHATRDDTYVPPFVKGMRRVPKHKLKRDRALTDVELRKVWLAAEGAGVYGAFIRIALLAAQRRETLLTMKWSDICADGVWHIPV